MKVTAIYVRVSSAGQAGDDKVSLGEQLQACRHKARELGAGDFVEISDVGPRWSSGRPGFQRLLGMCRRGEVEWATGSWVSGGHHQAGGGQHTGADEEFRDFPRLAVDRIWVDGQGNIDIQGILPRAEEGAVVDCKSNGKEPGC